MKEDKHKEPFWGQYDPMTNKPVYLPTFGISLLISHNLCTGDGAIIFKFLSKGIIIDSLLQVLDVQVNSLELVDPFHLLLLEATSQLSLPLCSLLSSSTEQLAAIDFLLIDVLHSLM